MDCCNTNSDSVFDPARSLIPIDETSADILAIIPKALFVGTGDHIALRAIDDGGLIVLHNVASGPILPIRALQLDPAATTSRDIVGLA